MMKIDTTKLLTIGGLALGFIGTTLTSIANDKKMDSIIADRVNEAIKNLNE